MKTVINFSVRVLITHEGALTKQNQRELIKEARDCITGWSYEGGFNSTRPTSARVTAYASQQRINKRKNK